MTNYANKLTSLAAKKQKLLQEETHLITRRKKEIGELAEKHGLLTLSDALITGIFSDVSDALKNKDDRVKQWETLGGRFLGPKRTGNGKSTRETSHSSSQTQ